MMVVGSRPPVAAKATPKTRKKKMKRTRKRTTR